MQIAVVKNDINPEYLVLPLPIDNSRVSLRLRLT